MNCEKRSTRWPCSRRCGRSLSSSSILPEAAIRLSSHVALSAPSSPSASTTPLIRNGWLQQWRSCIDTLLNDGPAPEASEPRRSTERFRSRIAR